MLVVSWQSSGKNFDVDTFLAEFHLEVDVVWHRGERERGRILETSGFRLCLGEDGTLQERLSDLHGFINRHQGAINALQRKGVENFVDFGFTVGSEAEFARTLSFAADELRLLVENDIVLQVSAYPSSSEKK